MYRASPRPHLGVSNHISIMLVPAYCPVTKRMTATQKTITVWPAEAVPMLKDCFETTDWQMFKEAVTEGNTVNLEEYSESVLAYIAKCVEDVTTIKTITISPNQKPWLNAEVHHLLRIRDAAFKAGDAEAFRAARQSYAQKIRGHFLSDDPHSMWKGIKSITDYNRKRAECPSDPSLPDALNIFYARFEASNTSTIARFKISPDDSPLSITSAEVRKTLQKITPQKAVGLDGVPGRTLKDCAHQLSSVMADIFNISLSQATIPTCLKTSTIVPVPKASTVSCLNDYRPITLTPIVMKCFERLVMASIKKSINITTDSHQYAYRPNRSAADAIAALIHSSITHLEKKNSYVRLLFLDFTSAFSTIIPQTMVNKLSTLGLAPSLCNWVLDFLTNRPITQYPPPSSSTLAPPRAASSVRCSTPCSLMTAEHTVTVTS